MDALATGLLDEVVVEQEEFVDAIIANILASQFMQYKKVLAQFVCEASHALVDTKQLEQTACSSLFRQLVLCPIVACTDDELKQGQLLSLVAIELMMQLSLPYLKLL